MDWKDKLFSFDGRIRRRDWWLWGIAIGVVNVITQFILGAVIGATAASNAAPGDTTAAAGAGLTAGIASLVVSLIFLWPSAALSIKRAHDRDKPAMFVIGYYALTVLFLIVMTFTMGSAFAAAGAGAGTTPEAAGMAAAGGGGIIVGILGLVLFVYAIWLLIELGFLDGTPGPNRFGPSPKGLGGSAEAFA